MPARRTKTLGDAQVLIRGDATEVATASADGRYDVNLPRTRAHLLQVLAVEHVRRYVGVTALAVSGLYVSGVATYV